MKGNRGFTGDMDVHRARDGRSTLAPFPDLTRFIVVPLWILRVVIPFQTALFIFHAYPPSLCNRVARGVAFEQCVSCSCKPIRMQHARDSHGYVRS